MGVPRAPAGPKLELCTTFQRRCEYELLVGDLICINTLIKNHYLLCQEAHSNGPNPVGYAMGVHWGYIHKLDLYELCMYLLSVI